MEDGFYKIRLTVGEEILEKMIYKGDYPLFVNEIKTNVSAINCSSLYSEDLKAAMQRVDFLNDKPGDTNSSSETRYLNRNRVFWGYSLYKMLHGNALTQLMTYKDNDNYRGIFKVY
jgi:hypothetical protein